MWLVHGTTRLRAESILKHGPDLFYPEHGKRPTYSYGFSMYKMEAERFLLGSAEDYAKKKAKLFPIEGGPVILEVEIPDEIVELAIQWASGLFQFDDGFGMSELLKCWPILKKRVRNV